MDLSPAILSAFAAALAVPLFLALMRRIKSFQHKPDSTRSFAALAREADLDATFQMVDIPPSFRADGETVLLNNHINVRVQGVRRDINFAGDYVVDFNTAEYNGNYDTKKVDDDYAIALYFSNVAIEYMQAQEPRSAFRYLKKGIETDPDIAGLWVNLGVLYARKGHHDMAVQAYQQALSVRGTHKSALVNLAGALDKLGREEEAETQFRTVVASVESGSRVYRDDQKAWYQAARQQL